MTVEYIDLTPTWSALLPVMLEVKGNGIKDFDDQFVIMARAADKWNEAVKGGLLATDYELDRRDTPTMCWTMDCTNTELTPGTIYCDDCNAFDEDNDPIDAEDFWLDNSDLDEEVYP